MFDRRTQGTMGLEHEKGTRSVSQTVLESIHAVTCQAISLIDLASYFGFCGLAVGVIERRVSGEAGITAGLVAAWQTRG